MTNLKTIKIFLASSSELKEDRQQFEIFIRRKNSQYVKQGIFLDLVLWEDFLDAMSNTRLQDEYNKAITECDIVISLFKTKVGQYTEEEVMTAWEAFKKNNKPLIYTYFKEATISINQVNIENLQSLKNFKTKLKNLGHFYTGYANIEGLKLKFDNQLTKLLAKRNLQSERYIDSDQLQLHQIEELKNKKFPPTTFSDTNIESSIAQQVDDPSMIIVDPNSKAPLNTITGAISLAEPGMRILILPGIYYETLILNKSLELIGMSKRAKDVKVHGSNKPTLSIQASGCRISNIAFYQSGSESNPAGIVTQGRQDIQNCDFSSSVGSGLIISNAAPLIRNSTIHNSLQFGVIFEAQSHGTIENCDIYENGLANILIREHSNPTVKHNTIHNGYQSGIYVYEGGQGLIEKNEIYNNCHAGLATSEEGSPIVRNNRITNSLYYGGIYVFRRGSGVFENNNLKGNIKGGFQVTEKCKPNIWLANNKE